MNVKRFSLLVILALVGAIIVAACGAAPAQAPAAAVEQEDTHEAEPEHEEDAHQHAEEGMEHGQELHEAAHGGQVGMIMGVTPDGTDFHVELVSDTPGEYRLYLSDNNREPVSPEGFEGTLAVIRPDGSEISSVPWMVMDDHLMAEGGPTDVSQLDVRVTIEGPVLTDVLETDFSLFWE